MNSVYSEIDFNCCRASQLELRQQRLATDEGKCVCGLAIHGQPQLWTRIKPSLATDAISRKKIGVSTRPPLKGRKETGRLGLGP